MTVEIKHLDSVTRANLEAAHMVRGIPAAQRKVPFRNIRHLLSLHATVAPDAVCLITYDAEGQRTEWSYAEFNARVHQTANLLHEDLGIQRGDRVAVLAGNHQAMVLIYFACWLIGAVVAPQNVAEPDAHVLRSSAACFVQPDYLKQIPPDAPQIVQLGGEPVSEYMQFYEMVRNQPMTYLGDDAAKAGDSVQRADTRSTAHLDDTALLIDGVLLTQYNLLAAAQSLAQAQAMTANQRLMSALPLHTVNSITTLMALLYAGGSMVLNPQFAVSTFWRRIIEDRVHLVSVTPTTLQALVEQGQANIGAGYTAFGEGVHRRGIIHFRHLLGSGVPQGLARAFEDLFGLPLLHGYSRSETTGYTCCLPIDLTWEAHRHWLLGYDYPSVGCPVDANEMAILDANGQRLGPGERGEICIRGHNVMQSYDQRPDANAEAFKSAWFRSGDTGYYLEDEAGRPFFFVTSPFSQSQSD